MDPRTTEELQQQLEAAKQEAEKAWREHYDAERAMERVERERVSAAREQVHAEWDARIEATHKIMVDAKQRCDEARVALSLSKSPLPLGAIYEKWDMPRMGYGAMSKTATRRKTGERGRVEIFVPSSEFHGSRYDRPETGAVVLRLLKKDGKPGKGVLRLGGHDFKAYWCPEGVDPNAKAREEALAREQAAAAGSD